MAICTQEVEHPDASTHAQNVAAVKRQFVTWKMAIEADLQQSFCENSER
jgi:hypothetical protein